MRKTKQAAAAPRPPVRDFGPTIRLNPAKAKAVPAPAGPPTPLQARQAAAAAVRVDPLRHAVKEFRQDPGQLRGNLVRGARVRDPLLKMFASGDISKRQWDAVQKYRDDVALASGARPDQFLRGGSAPAGGRAWPTDQQLDALRRVNRIMAGLGLVQRRLLVWTTLEHRTLRDFSREMKMRNETAGDMLQEVLNQLAEAQAAAEAQARAEDRARRAKR